MITLETQISGGQIADRLADDLDELGYFFERLSEQESLIKDLAEQINDHHNAGDIVAFCLKLAAAIEEDS